MEDALRLLTLPRKLGKGTDGEEIVVDKGRYGPYVRKGTDYRSLETEDQLFTVTLADAVELFSKPRTRGNRQASAPLAELGADPVSGGAVTVKEGRFGLYVTDGTVNASLRRGDSVETLTLERAAELLADRRARAEAEAAGGGSPGRGRRAKSRSGTKAAPARKVAAVRKAGTVRKAASARKRPPARLPRASQPRLPRASAARKAPATKKAAATKTAAAKKASAAKIATPKTAAAKTASAKKASVAKTAARKVPATKVAGAVNKTAGL